jgi:hypothetical protein
MMHGQANIKLLFKLARNGYEQSRQNFQKFSINLRKLLFIYFMLVVVAVLSNFKILAKEIGTILKKRTTSSKQKSGLFIPLRRRIAILVRCVP